MTATATPTSQAVTEWTRVFPKQVTETYTSSVTFMKQLTVVAVSTITYLKNTFPEESYSLEHFGGIKLRILKKKCRDELAHFLSTALTQAFEAFEKKYLHQLALCFYEDECKIENLIEYYVFEYSYTPQGVTMSVHSKTRDSAKQTSKYTFDRVRERTAHLIRACVVILQSCQNEMPETYDVSLRLYYNDDAPEGYQAPGFSAAPSDEDHLHPTMGEAMKLGFVETPFHKVVARTYIKDNIGSSHEALPSQNAPMMSQMEPDDFEAGPRPEGGELETSALLVCCPCNKQDRNVDEPMLICTECRSQQHAACFGLRSASRLAPHYCARCCDAVPTRPQTCKRVMSLPPRRRECLCIFRRTLWLCRSSSSVSARILQTSLGVTDANGTKLMKLLHSHGVTNAAHTHLDAPQPIMMECLESVMSKFFNSPDENIVDRLLAESFASQESQSDPVADVLSPLEKITLENASKAGKVIESNIETNQINAADDLTLKQYKEALMTNYQDNEDMSLSGSHDPIKDIENMGRNRHLKRKVRDENEENKPKFRTGVRTKKAKMNL